MRIRTNNSYSRKTLWVVESPDSTFLRSNVVFATACPRARSPNTRWSTSRVVLDDGSYHEVDSSDRAFQTAAQGCFRETFPRTKPVLLEPVMKVEIECPEAFQGSIAGDVTSRRGIISSTEMREGNAAIVAEVPLSETFGYATDLRSMTQGQGTFSMELSCYRKVPGSIQQEIIENRKKEKEQQLVGAK